MLIMAKFYSAVAVAALVGVVQAAETIEAGAAALLSGIPDMIAQAALADGVDTTAADSELSKLATELTSKTSDLSAAMASVPNAGAAGSAAVSAPASAGAGTVAVTTTDASGNVTASAVHAASSDIGQAVVAALAPAPDASGAS